MNRDEFIRQLRIALSGAVNSIIIEDNVRYYQEYIDAEIRKGRTEEQVLQELGNPRLIAKTIIETNKTAGTTEEAYESNEAYEQDPMGNEGRTNRVFRLPLWTIAAIGIFIVLFFFTIVTTALAALLPYLFPIILIVAVARLIRTLWR